MASFAAKLEVEARLCRKLRAAQSEEIGAAAMRAERLAELSFQRLLTLLEPRTARLTQRYGLTELAEDARQACAIAVHRALGSYDPQKARFTTHVTWQMRGELQSLRHRWRLNERYAARRIGMQQTSLDRLLSEGGDFADLGSVERAESGVSRVMASRYLEGLLEQSGAEREERALVHAHMFDMPIPDGFAQRTSEQRRQIIRRNIAHCARAAR
jgi:RNA polymerase sigma-32 factor